MEKREQRWAKEDAEREAYRKQYSGEVSAESLADLLEIWAQADRRRLKHRVTTRKGADLSRPKRKTSSKPRHNASAKVNREKEDERIEARYKKQDAILAEKWKYEDVKRIAKRKAQEHLIYLKRSTQSAKLAERRKEEDERHGLAREDSLGCASRLGTAT
jgi:hypothetical protein